MNHIISRYVLILLKFALLFKVSLGDTYSVRVQTDQHVNVVDRRFLSFTVDPNFLFLNSDKYGSKESMCMASSLHPAYIRIAGPSTSQLVFKNNTISFTNLTKEKEIDRENIQKDADTEQKDGISLQKDFNTTDDVKLNYESNQKVANQEDENPQSYKSEELTVTYSQWNQFLKWTQKVGFDLVFALNNEEKTPSGLWDPNTVLDILTVAEKANVAEMYWQLGYECTNQTIEEYLNDLETLRVIIDTFQRQGGWKVVGGDVTKCLATESKSDFKDYVTLSDELFDAILLNGNSSANELERMSEGDRLKLLQRLSDSTTPLWLTENPHLYDNTFRNEENISQFEESKSRIGRKWKSTRRSEARRTRSYKAVEKDVENKTKYKELFRAADWMTSLGYSAKNGFSVHFRELIEQEINEPTLSFYMALLYKNLVGERVLNVEMEASRAVLFAHCTSLRHKPVDGAVTLYGANLDDEPARFSVKLSKREEGGDVMQFVLGYDADGNIIVNGRPMHYEGDMSPTVRRLRPYKTLLIHLPPKSFGFWVLANTNIEACQHIDIDDVSDHSVEVIPAIDDADEIIDKIEPVDNNNDDEQKITDTIQSSEDLKDNTLKAGLDNLKIDLNNVHTLLQVKAKSKELNRRKRDINHIDYDIKEKLKRRIKNKRNNNDRNDKKRPKFEIIRRLFGLPKLNGTKHFQIDRSRIFAKLDKDKSIIAKSFAKSKVKPQETSYEKNILRRKRRSITKDITKKTKEVIEQSSENEIDVSDNDKMKLWKILKEIHEQLKDLPEDDSENESGNSDYMDEDIHPIIEETKSQSDGKMRHKVKHRTKEGILKSTVENIMGVLRDLNRNLNKFWSVISILD